jgi:hypothetical protein
VATQGAASSLAVLQARRSSSVLLMHMGTHHVCLTTPGSPPHPPTCHGVPGRARAGGGSLRAVVGGSRGLLGAAAHALGVVMAAGQTHMRVLRCSCMCPWPAGAAWRARPAGALAAASGSLHALPCFMHWAAQDDTCLCMVPGMCICAWPRAWRRCNHM